jgi:WD40 repeat protein
MHWVPGLAAVATILVTLCVSEDSCPAGGSSPRCKAAGSASTPRQNRTAKVPVQATADLLTQEVDELKAFIGLCQERITLLEELKSTVNSGVNLSLPESHMRILKEQLPLISEVTADEDKAPTSSADDYLISKAAIPQEDPVSFIRFLPLRNTRTSSPSSTAQTAMPSTLLVAVQADGGVRLFTPSGELVLSFSAGHEQPVVNLAVSPSHDEYFLTTADAGGVIRVHKVNVRQRRLTKEQKQSRRNSTDEKVSQYLGSQVNVTAQFTKQMQVPAASDGEPAKLTSLAVASQQGTKYFAAGDEEGKISIFTRNGTFRAKITASMSAGEKIESLHSHLSNLIFIAGQDWGFVNMEKLEVQRMDCPKFEGRVTSVVVDSQQSSRILVADEDGTVWVFNHRDKKNCKVEHRFPKGATVAPIDLASVRGFTIALEHASQGKDVASVLAINMSHVGKRQESLMGVSSAVVWRREREAVRDWAVHKRYQQGDLLAFLSKDGQEIEVFELLMQVYQAPSTDSFGNFKLPVIAVAIVLVLGYQYVKQKGKFGGGGGSSKKYDWDSSDFAALRNKKKLGGLGGLGKGRAGLR